MKKAYPEVEIIGEEDLSDPLAIPILFKDKLLIEHYSRKHDLQKRLEDNLAALIEDSKKKIILNEDEVPKQKPYRHFDQLIKKRKVKILLDPLDATYSFINKQFEESTILVGVLVNNKPYIGSITSPFYVFDPHLNKTGVITYFNIPNNGIFSFKNQKSQLFDNVDNYKLERVKLTKQSPIIQDLYPYSYERKELKLIVSRWKVDKLNQIRIIFVDLVKPLVNEHVIKNLLMKVDNGMGYRSIKMIEDGYYFMTVKSSKIL